MLIRIKKALKLGLMIVFLSACSSNDKKPYQDNFPEPCTKQWFIEIEKELRIADPMTGRPPPGYPQWLNAVDEKLNVSNSSYQDIGDIEWCHQVHQLLIGFLTI